MNWWTLIAFAPALKLDNKFQSLIRSHLTRSAKGGYHDNEARVGIGGRNYPVESSLPVGHHHKLVTLFRGVISSPLPLMLSLPVTLPWSTQVSSSVFAYPVPYPSIYSENSVVSDLSTTRKHFIACQTALQMEWLRKWKKANNFLMFEFYSFQSNTFPISMSRTEEIIYTWLNPNNKWIIKYLSKSSIALSNNFVELEEISYGDNPQETHS